MQQVNYYENKEYISNSDLSSLRDDELDISKPKAIQRIYDFGNLVDKMITEPQTVERFYNQSLCDGDDYILATKLSDKLINNPVISRLLKYMNSQHEIYKSLKVTYNGENFLFKARCKFDGYSKDKKISVDYKTTKCKSQKEFENSIIQFGYHRQGAYYMDLGGTDQHWIFGVSKVNKEIFTVVMHRNSELYKKGKMSYSEYAYKWKMYFSEFKEIS